MTLISNKYTEYSEVFRNALLSGNFSQFEALLSDETELVVHLLKSITGAREICNYWDGWRKRYVSTGIITDFNVLHSNFFCHSCLQMKTMLAVMHIENNKIVRMILLCRRLADAQYSHHDDLVVEYPFKSEYIRRYLKPLRESDKDNPIVTENRIPCLSCGIPSHNLEWYSTYLTYKVFQYPALVSICPKCGKVIEYYPEAEIRLDKPVADNNDMTNPDNDSIAGLSDSVSTTESNHTLPEFSVKGIEFHENLLFSVVSDPSKKDKGEVFSHLSSLSLDHGWHLGLRLADPNNTSRGGVSDFFVYQDDGTIDNGIHKYLNVAPTAMSVWQAYLILTAYTVMPTYWHGEYKERKFIFKESELDEIEPLKCLDMSSLLARNILLPLVTISQDDNTGQYVGHVYCTYWNKWEGLVREHVTIGIKDNKVESYDIEDSLALYKYNCRIWF